MVYALGCGEQLLAVSHECDYPAEARTLPQATRSRIDSSRSSGEIDRQVAELAHESGGALYELDAQLIARLAPDVILTQAQCDVCAVRYADVVDLVATTPEFHDTRVIALNPTSLDDVFSDIRRIGDALNVADAATQLVECLNGRVQQVQKRTSNAATSRPRVACIEWVEPLMLAGNWTPELIEFAGGNPGDTPAGRHSVYSDWNDLLRFDPEVLLISPCGFDLQRSVAEAQSLRHRPGWEEITAVRQERTWVIDGNAYLNRSGPRLVDSLEIVGHLIHPAAVPQPSWCDPNRLPWARFGA